MLSPARTRMFLAGAAGFVFIIATNESIAQTATIDVSASVEEECLLATSAITIAFGIYDNIQIDRSADFSFDCPAGKSLTFAISDGQINSTDGSYMLPNTSNTSSVPLTFFLFDPDQTSWTNGYNITSQGGPETKTFSATMGAGQLNNPAILPGDFAEQLTLNMTIN